MIYLLQITNIILPGSGHRSSSLDTATIGPFGHFDAEGVGRGERSFKIKQRAFQYASPLTHVGAPGVL